MTDCERNALGVNDMLRIGSISDHSFRQEGFELVRIADTIGRTVSLASGQGVRSWLTNYC